MKVNKTIFLLVVGLMILPTFGGTIELSGITNENPGDGIQIALSATFELSWIQGTGTLEVWVTNNSPEYSEISEIYLNLPIGSGITGIKDLSVSDGYGSNVTSDWMKVYDTDNAGAAHDQYGTFDFGAKLKKKKDGISPGSPLLFEFHFEGDLAELTVGDFESALSIPEGDGPVSIAEAKWIHIIGDGYDDQSGWGGTKVPEPSTLILLLSGTGLLAGAARFRKKT